MSKRRFKRFLIIAALAAGAAPAMCQLPLGPPHETGASITGAFEGWYKNPDGSFSFLLGYFNRNTLQELEIPIGPDNRIEPGGPDLGQPAWFLPGRQWGMFTVKVPANFGDKKLTWTIVANEQQTAIPLSLKPDYEVSPFQEAAGNTPPALRFDAQGAVAKGPGGLNASRTVKAGSPLSLTVWVSDDLKPGSGSGALSKKQLAHPVTVTWSKYRGPGNVSFSNSKPDVEETARKDGKLPFSGKATTEAVFDRPGDYILHVYANDYSGEGGAGFECCWTYGDVKVSVLP